MKRLGVRLAVILFALMPTVALLAPTAAHADDYTWYPSQCDDSWWYAAPNVNGVWYYVPAPWDVYSLVANEWLVKYRALGYQCSSLGPPVTNWKWWNSYGDKVQYFRYGYLIHDRFGYWWICLNNDPYCHGT